MQIEYNKLFCNSETYFIVIEILFVEWNKCYALIRGPLTGD